MEATELFESSDVCFFESPVSPKRFETPKLHNVKRGGSTLNGRILKTEGQQIEAWKEQKRWYIGI